MSDETRVAVLASGGGTNFQALIDRLHRPDDEPVRLVRLLAGSPGIGALERARSAGITTATFDPAAGDGPSEHEAWLGRELERADPDLVTLAGYLRLVPASVVGRYRGRMINLHPALLPTFGGEGMYGHRVHEAVVESGARVTGPTVHFVNEEYDQGAIIAQWPVPVHDGDSPDDVAERVLGVEHRLLPAVVRAFAADAFRLTDDGRCRWERPWFGGDAFRITTTPDDGGGEPPASAWMDDRPVPEQSEHSESEQE
ncbi:MAG: phosphoribosylglycinamide formyltransferase [Candidatus Palauibacterales bacterium]|nr:phosphoribosylglycinamide formyltransferase [Candidatus Palauibacterales bacterium]